MNVTLKKPLTIIVAVGTFLMLGIQLVRPARTNPATDPAAALAGHVQVPPDISAILNRSCRDCHSHDTRWPWYSNVAPVSWWVIDHVNHGRSHFNFSEWGKYNSQEQQKLLQRACELVGKREMPLPSYLRMHDARMSPQDIDVLCNWTQQASISNSQFPTPNAK